MFVFEILVIDAEAAQGISNECILSDLITPQPAGLQQNIAWTAGFDRVVIGNVQLAHTHLCVPRIRAACVDHRAGACAFSLR